MTADEKADLLARLAKAEAKCRRLAEAATDPPPYYRRIGKADGLSLAASYVRVIEVTE